MARPIPSLGSDKAKRALRSTKTWRLKMSVVSAMKFSPAQAGTASEIKNATRSRSVRLGSFVLAVAIPLTMAACTGGAGLDIGPVDNSCHVNPQEQQGQGS